jgi:hypothetical protein
MSKLMKLYLSLSVFVLWAAASHAVTNTSLTLDNCAGCKGSDLTLSVDDNGDGTFTVKYTFDTTGYNDQFIGLSQVGFKVITGWTDADLISAPGGLGNWSDVFEAPVTSSGSPCSVGGDSTDKICIYAKNSIFDVRPNGTYTWEFTITGGTLLPTSDWHFGGQWCDTTTDCNGQIISTGASSTPVPEPTAALLFGAGTLVVGHSLRRPARRIA